MEPKFITIQLLLHLFFWGGNCVELQYPAKNPASIPALGIPFKIGDYYNVEKNQRVVLPCLWNGSVLEDLVVINNHHSAFKMVKGDQTDDKLDMFSVNAELHINILDGMVKVDGSAKYLHDRKSKNNVRRMNLEYQVTTQAKSLKPYALHPKRGMEWWEEISRIRQFAKDGLATHLVVGIEYGAKAVFVFEEDVNEDSETGSVQGQLNIAVNIGGVSLTGKGKVNMTNEESSTNNQLKINFHGDYILKDQPLDIKGAVKVYKTLPTLLGKNYELAIPQTVYLYPIAALKENAAIAMLEDLTKDCYVRIQDQFALHSKWKKGIKDTLTLDGISSFARITEDLNTMTNKIERMDSQFKSYLLAITPALARIKHITENEPILQLAKYFDILASSPFRKANMRRWVNEKKEEGKVLASIKYLPNLCGDDGCFAAAMNNYSVTWLIGLKLTLSNQRRPLPKRMDHFLDDYGNKSVSNKEWVYSYKTKLHENDLITDPEGYDYLGLHERLKWWDADHPAQQYLKGYGSDVERFYELDTEMNKMNPKKSIISFAVREAMLMDENDTTLEPSSILQLFETGTMADKDRLQEIWQADKFEIPSIPGTPLLDSSKPNAITHDTINLRWRQPIRGTKFITKMDIEILKDARSASMVFAKPKIKEETGQEAKCKDGHCVWKVIRNVMGAKTSFKVTGLERSTEYFFRIAVYSQWGLTAKSQESIALSTTACSKGWTKNAEKERESIQDDKRCFLNKPCIPTCEKCDFDYHKDWVGDESCANCTVPISGYWGPIVEAFKGWINCLTAYCFKDIVANWPRVQGKDQKLKPKIRNANCKEDSDIGRWLVVMRHQVANDNNTFAHARWKDYATNGIGQGNPKEKYYWFPLDKLRKLITAPNGDSERWQLLFKVIYDSNEQLNETRRRVNAGYLILDWVTLGDENSQFVLKAGRVNGPSEVGNFEKVIFDAVNMGIESSNVNLFRKLILKLIGDGLTFNTADKGRSYERAHMYTAHGYGGGWWFGDGPVEKDSLFAPGCICLTCNKKAVGDQIWCLEGFNFKPLSTVMAVRKMPVEADSNVHIQKFRATVPNTHRKLADDPQSLKSLPPKTEASTTSLHTGKSSTAATDDTHRIIYI